MHALLLIYARLQPEYQRVQVILLKNSRKVMTPFFNHLNNATIFVPMQAYGIFFSSQNLTILTSKDKWKFTAFAVNFRRMVKVAMNKNISYTEEKKFREKPKEGKYSTETWTNSMCIECRASKITASIC